MKRMNRIVEGIKHLGRDMIHRVRQAWRSTIDRTDQIACWHALKGFGRLRALRTSYFWLVAVPLLAQWLSQVDREVELSILGHSFTLIFDLPFSWKVFYFSSVSFSIATTRFLWRCPGMIKDYDSFEDFKKREGESQLLLKMPIVRDVQMSNSEERLVAFVEQFCKSPGNFGSTCER